MEDEMKPVTEEETTQNSLDLPSSEQEPVTEEETKENSLDPDSEEHDLAKEGESSRAKRLQEMIEDEKEREKKEREAKLSHLLKTDLAFRRNYYQHDLFLVYNMIPADNYYKAELQEITDRYNKAFDKIGTLSDEEEMKVVIEKFKKSTKHVMGNQKGHYIILSVYIILAIVFFVAMYFSIRKYL